MANNTNNSLGVKDYTNQLMEEASRIRCPNYSCEGLLMLITICQIGTG